MDKMAGYAETQSRTFPCPRGAELNKWLKYASLILLGDADAGVLY
jgi:hypothetical protein